MRLLQITLLLLSSMTVMAGAVIAPALPFITDAFSEVPRVALWSKLILTFPALFIALFSPVAGYLLDRFGKKRLLLISLVAYGLAGGAGLVLDDLFAILASRAVLGIAVSFIMTGATALVGDYMEGDIRTRFLGIQGAFMAFGGTVFVSLAGFLADMGWRYPFAIYLAAFAVLVLSWTVLYEPEAEDTSISANPSDNQSPFTRLILVIYLTVLFGMTLFYVIPVQSPFLLKKMGAESGIMLSLGLIAGTFCAATASLLHRTIKRQLNFFQIYSLLFILMGTGFLLISQAETIPTITAATALAGFGAGFLMPNTSLCLLSQAAPRHRGRIMGGMTSAVFIGQFISPLVFEPLIQSASIEQAHAVGGGIALMVALLFFLAGRPRKQPDLVSSPTK